jgi:hypothetical protein
MATFLLRTMVPLRPVAILGNLLFALLGCVQRVHPVVFLHLVLLPDNSRRFFTRRARPGSAPQICPSLGFKSCLEAGLRLV